MLLTQLIIKSALGREFDGLIGEIKIINNTSSPDRPDYGNYTVIFNGVEYKDLVTNFNRNDRAWKLLNEVLKALDKKGVLN